MPVSSSTMRILCMLCHGRGERWLGDYWQFHHEARSSRLVLFHANGSVMFFDDAAHDGQAETGPALSGGEIGQKKSLLQLAGHAMAGIGDGDLDCIAAGHQ